MSASSSNGNGGGLPEASLEELNVELLAAAFAQDKDKVARCLAQGADVNARNNFGESSLHLAAKGREDPNADLELIKLLLENGCESSVGDARNGFSFIRYLLHEGKNAFDPVPCRINAEGFHELCEFLVKKELVHELFYPSGQDRSPISLAVAKLEILYETLELLEGHCDWAVTDDSGASLLMYSFVGKRSTLFLRELISRAPILLTHITEEGFTVLHMAIKFGTHRHLRELVRRPEVRQFLNAPDTENWTPLHFALTAYVDPAEKVKILLEAKVDISIPLGPEEHSVLFPVAYHAGKYRSLVDIIDQLIKAGAEFDRKDPFQNNFLHVMFRKPHLDSRQFKELIQYLVRLERTSLLYQENKYKDTPLHRAVRNLLLEPGDITDLGLEWNILDGNGDSMLGVALLAGRNWQAFLQLQLDPSHVNHFGEGLLHHCAETGNSTALKALLGLDDPPRVDVQDKAGNTALHTALKHGKRKMVDIVQKLVFGGARNVIVIERKGWVKSFVGRKNKNGEDALALLAKRTDVEDCLEEKQEVKNFLSLYQ